MKSNPYLFEPHCDTHDRYFATCEHCIAASAEHTERHIRAREDLLRLRVPAETDWLDS